MVICLQRNAHKARKRHICDWCLSFIEIGETYNRASMIDGDLYTFKSHLPCDELADHFMSQADDDCFTSLEFDSWLQEEFWERKIERPATRREQVAVILEAIVGGGE